MTQDENDHQLIYLLADLEEEAVLDIVHKRIETGEDPLMIIEDCNEGMRLVGERYEQGKYFISGLIMSGEIFREVIDILQPLLSNRTDFQSSGKILLGTVAGDIHDIGKNIVGTLMSCHGFTVMDLGIDVPPYEFARKAVEFNPDIVGLSGLITASFESMKDTISILRTEARIHNLDFKILIGGGILDSQIAKYVGADSWVTDAMSGVRICQRYMKMKAAKNDIP